MELQALFITQQLMLTLLLNLPFRAKHWSRGVPSEAVAANIPLWPRLNSVLARCNPFFMLRHWHRQLQKQQNHQSQILRIYFFLHHKYNV